MPNKINPYSPFALQVQSEVLQRLQGAPLSTNEVAKALNRPYHTVRQAILELENNGTVVPLGRSYRNTKYKLADGTVVSHRILPTVRIEDREVKITLVANNWTIESRAEVAARNISRHLVRLLKIAERLSKGDRAADTSLPLIKHEMEQDRDYILNLLNVYNQIIKNGKIWSADHLALFPNDTDWNQQDIDNAYVHYFGENH